MKILGVVLVLLFGMYGQGVAHHAITLRNMSVADAVWKGDTHIIGELIDAGQINLSDAGHGDKATPLMWALHELQSGLANNKSAEEIAQLRNTIGFYIDHQNANHDNVDNEGLTALHHSAWVGDINTINLLLKRDVDINQQTHDSGETALMYAYTYADNMDTVKFLVEQDANINISNNNNTTVLHLAVAVGDVEAVQLFLDNGADVNLKSDDHGTPLDVAFKSGNATIIAELLRQGAKGEMYPDGYKPPKKKQKAKKKVVTVPVKKKNIEKKTSN